MIGYRKNVSLLPYQQGALNHHDKYRCESSNHHNCNKCKPRFLMVVVSTWFNKYAHQIERCQTFQKTKVYKEFNKNTAPKTLQLKIFHQNTTSKNIPSNFSNNIQASNSSKRHLQHQPCGIHLPHVSNPTSWNSFLLDCLPPWMHQQSIDSQSSWTLRKWHPYHQHRLVLVRMLVNGEYSLVIGNWRHIYIYVSLFFRRQVRTIKGMTCNHVGMITNIIYD